MEIGPQAGVAPGARLLYVTLAMEYGGAEGQLAELACGLDPDRFRPHLCCIRGAGPLLRPFAERRIPRTVFDFPPLDYAGKARSARQLLREVRTVARLMRVVRPHLVHGVLPVACVVAGLAARLAGVPLIVTGRRSLGLYRDGRPLLRFLERVVGRRTDRVVANSEAVLADAIARERLSPEKVLVIRNGVRIPAAPPRASWRDIVGEEIGGPVVCLPANFFPYKGHMDFLEAAAAVAREAPRARFVLVGDGSLRAAIERRAAEPGLAGRVRLLGVRPDCRDIMALSDVVVLASHEEGFPNVVLEAMAAGRPVVATRVGGVPEAVEDGVTGLLVPARDPAALAGAIGRLLSDRDAARRMGMRGLDRARREFTVERMVGAYEDLYEELLARKGLGVGRGE
ncbi:MAG: glycosyltransferase [bacterium]|nr:glycosyltransferase [bacterium]